MAVCLQPGMLNVGRTSEFPMYQVCMYVYSCRLCIYVFTYVCMYWYVFTYDVCVYVCMYVCMYEYVCIFGCAGGRLSNVV